MGTPVRLWMPEPILEPRWHQLGRELEGPDRFKLLAGYSDSPYGTLIRKNPLTIIPGRVESMFARACLHFARLSVSELGRNP